MVRGTSAGATRAGKASGQLSARPFAHSCASKASSLRDWRFVASSGPLSAYAAGEKLRHAWPGLDLGRDHLFHRARVICFLGGFAIPAFGGESQLSLMSLIGYRQSEGQHQPRRVLRLQLPVLPRFGQRHPKAD